MDPNIATNPSNFELPEPVKKQEAGKSSEVSTESESKPEKVQSMDMELPGSATMVSPSATAPPVIAPMPVNAQSVSPAIPSAINSATPALADDVDLIEKEWVQKAKAIVAHTSNDPHMQNKELNKVKADYIKKRYNKEVKISEE